MKGVGMVKNLSFNQKLKIRSTAAIIGGFAIVPLIFGLIVKAKLLWISSLTLVILCEIVRMVVWKCSECGSQMPTSHNGLIPIQCKKCGHFQIENKNGPFDPDNL